MEAIRAAGVRIGVDPLGGAAVGYWAPIAERYGIDLTVTDDHRRSDLPTSCRSTGTARSAWIARRPMR